MVLPCLQTKDQETTPKVIRKIVTESFTEFKTDLHNGLELKYQAPLKLFDEKT